MDREGLQRHLTEYLRLLAEIAGFRLGTSPEYKRINRELMMRGPGVRRILNELQPDLGNYSRKLIHECNAARAACNEGLGILRYDSEINLMLIPDSPTLRTDRLHHQVWSAARTLWATDHYRLAVQQAAEAVNALMQSRAGRRNVSNTTLAKDCFNIKAPAPGVPRLRMQGDRSTETWKSVQEGTMFLGMACFRASFLGMACFRASEILPRTSQAMSFLNRTHWRAWRH